MQPFTVHRGVAVPLLRRDVDTDQIIPKQFLKSVERTGFGAHLFSDWRRSADGSPEPAFVLNDPRYAGGSILVAGENFGCGSSREHAAWALLEYGFRVIIAPSFADIFRGNAVGNGLLPVALPHDRVSRLAARAAREPGCVLTVDLEARRVTDDQGVADAFDIDDASRHRLLNGLDDIGLILRYEPAIARYEARHSSTVAASAG